MTEAEMLSLHEIYRAEVVISRFRGSDARETVDALVHYAEAHEMSVHAVALAVLARGPTADDPLDHVCVEGWAVPPQSGVASPGRSTIGRADKVDAVHSEAYPADATDVAPDPGSSPR